MNEDKDEQSMAHLYNFLENLRNQEDEKIKRKEKYQRRRGKN